MLIIGVAASVGALVLVLLGAFVLWRFDRHSRRKKDVQEEQAFAAEVGGTFYVDQDDSFPGEGGINGYMKTLLQTHADAIKEQDKLKKEGKFGGQTEVSSGFGTDQVALLNEAVAREALSKEPERAGKVGIRPSLRAMFASLRLKELTKGDAGPLNEPDAESFDMLLKVTDDSWKGHQGELIKATHDGRMFKACSDKPDEDDPDGPCNKSDKTPKMIDTIDGRAWPNTAFVEVRIKKGTNEKTSDDIRKKLGDPTEKEKPDVWIYKNAVDTGSKFGGTPKDMTAGPATAQTLGLSKMLTAGDAEQLTLFKARQGERLEGIIKEIFGTDYKRDSKGALVLNSYGDEIMQKQLKYILEERAGHNEELFQNGALQVRRDAAPDGKILDEGPDNPKSRIARYTEGENKGEPILDEKGNTQGMALQDFVDHEYSKYAGLEKENVVALRLYTTNAFKSLNIPLRFARDKPHPFPVTVAYIEEGIKLLRTTEAELFAKKSVERAAMRKVADAYDTANGRLAAWDAKIPDDDECIHVEREGGKDGKEGTVLKATLGPKLPTFTGIEKGEAGENGKSGEKKKSRVWITKTPIKLVEEIKPKGTDTTAGPEKKVTYFENIKSGDRFGKGPDDEMDLWRGMRDMKLEEDFAQKGGTEFAMMSTTKDLSIAVQYGSGGNTCLLVKITTEDFKTRGADLTYLSAFPGEREYLFPPLTYLKPTGRTDKFKVYELFNTVLPRPEAATKEQIAHEMYVDSKGASLQEAQNATAKELKKSQTSSRKNLNVAAALGGVKPGNIIVPPFVRAKSEGAKSEGSKSEGSAAAEASTDSSSKVTPEEGVEVPVGKGKLFFYTDAMGGRQGPVPVADLKKMMRGGAVMEDVKVWCNGMDDWKKATEVAEFKGVKMNASNKNLTRGLSSAKVSPYGNDDPKWLKRHWYVDLGYTTDAKGDTVEPLTADSLTPSVGSDLKIPVRNLGTEVTGEELLKMVSGESEKGRLTKYSWVRHRTERVWVQVGQLATPNIYPSLVKRFKEQEKAEKEKGAPFLPQHNFDVIIMECKPQLP